MLDLKHCLVKTVAELSLSDLQSFLIALTCVQQAEVYIFDEPFSYLDLTQRVKAARLIATLKSPHTYVVCADNDLTMLEYICDTICCTYGVSGIYGALAVPIPTRKVITSYIQGNVHIDGGKI